jgi:hypothetical protein
MKYLFSFEREDTPLDKNRVLLLFQVICVLRFSFQLQRLGTLPPRQMLMRSGSM